MELRFNDNIKVLTAPIWKTELRRLNSMLNQLAKFIPHLSENIN